MGITRVKQKTWAAFWLGLTVFESALVATAKQELLF